VVPRWEELQLDLIQCACPLNNMSFFRLLCFALIVFFFFLGKAYNLFLC
jgi:hypothetical protein